MLVVTELEEPFLPLPDELLVNLKDSRPVVEALLDALPSTYSSSTSSDSAMGPALQVGVRIMFVFCFLNICLFPRVFGHNIWPWDQGCR
jgi:hypothetical protein